jgi:hypothetical protein
MRRRPREKQTADSARRLAIEAAHRSGDAETERALLKEAIANGDASAGLRGQLVRRLELDRDPLSALRVLDDLKLEGTAGMQAAKRIETDLLCHGIKRRFLSVEEEGALGEQPEGLRAQAYGAMAWGEWWYAQSRFRALADSFARKVTLEDSARAAYVDANMRDMSIADRSIAALYPRARAGGNGNAEYWLAAALLTRQKVPEARRLFQEAQRRGSPLMLASHSNSPEVVLFQQHGMKINRSHCPPPAISSYRSTREPERR